MDYGKKRIGIAISDPTGTIAQPLFVIERKSEKGDLESIKELVLSHQVEKIIIGLPLSLSGKLGQSASEVVAFAKRLEDELTDVEIETWDERMTTAFAEKEMIRDRVRRKKRRKVIDKLAATLILQSYLDAKREND